MFAITGITGNVGGEVARTLLAAKQPVRAVVRDLRKGADWAERGCTLAPADIADTSALAAAFQGAKGVFVLIPPNFDPAPGFPEAQATADMVDNPPGIVSSAPTCCTDYDYAPRMAFTSGTRLGAF